MEKKSEVVRNENGTARDNRDPIWWSIIGFDRFGSVVITITITIITYLIWSSDLMDSQLRELIGSKGFLMTLISINHCIFWRFYVSYQKSGSKSPIVTCFCDHHMRYLFICHCPEKLSQNSLFDLSQKDWSVILYSCCDRVSNHPHPKPPSSCMWHCISM